MTLTGLVLILVPLALVVALVAMLRQRGTGMPLGRWIALVAAGSLSSALLLPVIGAGGISGVDWRESALVALGSLTLGLLATALIYARARSGA